MFPKLKWIHKTNGKVSKLQGIIWWNYYPLIIAFLPFFSWYLSRKMPELFPLTNETQPATAVGDRSLRSPWLSLWRVLRATAQSSSFSSPWMQLPAQESLARTHTRLTKTKLSRENMALVQFSCCVFKRTMQRSLKKKKKKQQQQAPILDLKSRIRPLCEAIFRLVLSCYY